MNECQNCWKPISMCDCVEEPKTEPLPVRSESSVWVYDDELSPELNELLANTPILTDADIEELAEANRRLGLPWWKRLFMKPNEKDQRQKGGK